MRVRRYVFFLMVRVVRFAADPAFGADRAAEALPELVERDDVERPVVPDARDAFEREVAAERALVERDAADRPVVPERADPDFAVEREAREAVDLLAARDRAAVLDERVFAVLRPDVLRLEVLREPELDAVVFFLAAPVEVFRCLGN